MHKKNDFYVNTELVLLVCVSLVYVCNKTYLNTHLQ